MLAAEVRSGRTRARAVAEAAIERHEASDLNAYIVFDAEGALRQADRIDRAVSRGEDPGPLAGIPVSVKDLYGVEGLPMRAGTRRELPERWRREGFLVRAMRRLGGVIVGKTHTVELAFGGVGLNPNTGTPLNPWSPADPVAPGGSSAGAGVSLVEGSAMIALGTDTGGSVRIPASATGVVGHRHTTGRWPTSGVVPLSTTLDTVGLLTRTAEDSRHVFGLVDPLARPGAAASGARTDLAALRIGIPREGLWQRSQDDIVRACRHACDLLRDAGAQIVPIDAPELFRAGELYVAGGLVQPERFESLERHLPGWTPILHPTVGKRLETAPEVRAVDYIGLLRRRHRLSRRLHARMREQGADLLATPTLPVSPPRIAALDDLDFYRAVNRDMLSATGAASMLDMCAVSLPVGLDDCGLPVGLQLIGPTGGDRELLDWAVLAERRLPALPAPG